MLDRGNSLHGPNRSEEFWKRMWRAPQQLLQQEAEPQRDARFEMADRARQDERHKISSTIRSQHKPMQATPGGPIPRCTTRDWSRCSSQVWAVRVSWPRGPRPKPSKRPSGRDKTRVLGYVPITRQHPSTSKPQVPAASPVLARWSVWQPVSSKPAARKMQDNVSPTRS